VKRTYDGISKLLMHHPKYSGVTANNNHTRYQEPHDEEECLGSMIMMILDNGTGLQIGIVVKFTLKSHKMKNCKWQIISSD